MTVRSDDPGWSFDECCIVGALVLAGLGTAIFLLMPMLVVQQ